jgi:hypothetical protein
VSAADGKVLGHTQIVGSAPLRTGFTIVLLAEGFKADEQLKFNAACDRFVTVLLATSPFDELSNAINVFRVNVASTDTGADDPQIPGQSDTGTGKTVRTYFDATFSGDGRTRRLLVCDETIALKVAGKQVPGYTAAVVVVNSEIYGGADSGAVAAYSLGGESETAIHELGHSKFNLGDEYPFYSGPKEKGDGHHPAEEPQELNVTVVRKAATLKWRWAITPGAKIPTMTNPNCANVDNRKSTAPDGTVGLFEGAHYYHCGAYRPEFDCKMRSLGVPFCTVCAQAIRARLEACVPLTATPQTAISVAATDAESLDVFAVASDSRTMTNAWAAASGWDGWSQIAGGKVSPGSPVTVAETNGRIDAFTVGTNNRVYTAWRDATSAWSGWSIVGTPQCRPGSTVTAISRDGQVDLFTTDGDGRVMSVRRDPYGNWGSWFVLPGITAASGATVTAVARISGRLDLFTVGADNIVGTTWLDDYSAQNNWVPIGNQQCRPDSSIAAVVRDQSRMDLFTVADDGHVITNRWTDGEGWNDWFGVAGGKASPGSQVCTLERYPGHLDLFVVGTDARIWSTWWDEGEDWVPWFVVTAGKSVPGGQVAAYARVTDRIDLFVAGTNSNIYTTSWTYPDWRGWSQLGVT